MKKHGCVWTCECYWGSDEIGWGWREVCNTCGKTRWLKGTHGDYYE